jgi:hypothetical protein
MPSYMRHIVRIRPDNAEVFNRLFALNYLQEYILPRGKSMNKPITDNFFKAGLLFYSIIAAEELTFIDHVLANKATKQALKACGLSASFISLDDNEKISIITALAKDYRLRREQIEHLYRMARMELLARPLPAVSDDTWRSQ